MPTSRRTKKLQRVLMNRQPDLTVVCENIHDPHNVSAILRSCDAVGVANIYLLYTGEEFPRLGKKSSASANKWIEVKRFRQHKELREALKEQEMNIYATHVNHQSLSVYEVDWTQPAAIIVGNEHQGVSDEVLDIADSIISIPMFGMIESLNVSVATAVILYEACRQRIYHHLYPNPRLTPGNRSSILETWQKK